MGKPMNESNSNTSQLIAISKPAARVVVGFRNHTIASTENALVLEEQGYPPIIYIPVRDVDLSCLESSTTITFCPRKGRAAHHHLLVRGKRSIDAAWNYADPLSEVGAIVDHFAFYEHRVDKLSMHAPTFASAKFPSAKSNWS
jgi:uncharacterized protein (DUF427 family)